MSGIRSDLPRKADIAIVGGGLAGGLTALAILRARPDLSLALIEAGACFGGNHRWSWFESDLDPAAAALLACFPTAVWKQGTSVRFPDYVRALAAPYRSLASRDFDARLRQLLPRQAILTGCQAESLAADGVRLADGRQMAAARVIDCRDFVPSAHLSGGWQVFLGRHLRTAHPHGLTRPIVMDAAVAQHGGYRFIYSLPLAGDEIFVEDTYYADEPALDPAVLGRRVEAYCADRGWHGEVIGEERGVLPVVTGGDPAAHRAAMGRPGVALAGARGLFGHPLTSYTLPFAAANALAIAEAAALPAAELAALVERRAQEHWRATRFYRDLGRMLFLAAAPEQRYRVFARFYRLPEPLIERFYAGRSTTADKLRLLMGKPPVPIHRGLAALLGKGPPLAKEGPQ